MLINYDKLFGIIIALLIICLPFNATADVIIDNPHTSLELITTARDLLSASGELDLVVESLNGILLMPLNENTEEAKMLIGVAHERQGKIEKAKHDYAAYIAEYPGSDMTQTIRQKLIALEINQPIAKIDTQHPRTADVGSSAELSGSITEYYYSSSSNKDIGDWKTDQSALITGVNLTGTFKENEYVTKTILRYTDSLNLTPYLHESSRIAVAYVGINDTFRDYGFKIGRQNPSPGVLGRFDGFTATSKISHDIDIGIQTGVPFTGSTDNRRFYNANVNFVASSTTTLTGYYNYQLVDLFVERSALGMQVQYLLNNTTVLSNIEYDTLYSAINSFMLQGFTALGAYNIYTLVDIRRSPVLFADRALPLGINSSTHMPYLTVADMLSNTTLSNSEIYQYINTTTPTLSTYVIGVDGPIIKNWSAAINIQQSNMTPVTDPSFIPTPEAPIVVQTPGSISNSLNLRLTGIDVFTKHSTLDLLASISVDNLSTSNILTAIYSKNINDVARIDFLIRRIARNQSVLSVLLDTESIRLNYKCGKSVSIESQIEVSTTLTTDNITQTTSTAYNNTFLIGLRYDF